LQHSLSSFFLQGSQLLFFFFFIHFTKKLLGSSSSTVGGGEEQGNSSSVSSSANSDAQRASEREELNKAGMFTAVAIAVHNLPESVATFVSTLNSPQVGIVLALAVAIHHLPEGICISMPIYFSTKSKLKAFLVTLFLGAVTQPLAAVLAYLVFAAFWSPIADGVLTGFTAGMLVYIVAKNLYPAAVRHDPKGKVVSASFFAGILLISLSLIGFSYVS